MFERESKTVDITLANKSIEPEENIEHVIITGTWSNAARNVNVDGTWSPNSEVRFLYTGTGTGTATLTIFTKAIPTELLTVEFQCTAFFDGTLWHVSIEFPLGEEDVIPANTMVDSAQIHTVTVPVSFETGELNTPNTIRFGNKVEILSLFGALTKAIVTDNATVTTYLNSVATAPGDPITTGVITFTTGDGDPVDSPPFGSPAGFAALVTPTAQNSSDSGWSETYMHLYTEKTTPGGKALISVVYKIID